MKLLRTIRFDMSDDNVFELGAQPDEWAVSGAFAFAGIDPASVTGKAKQAFANGFLGTASFGRSTFASVAEADETETRAIEDALAAHFVEQYGAPDLEAARPVAREEIDFIADLCGESLINTIFTVRRHFDDDGHVHEEFRTIQAPASQPMHSRIWNVIEDDA